MEDALDAVEEARAALAKAESKVGLIQEHIP